ncbi:putative DNA mismatch repair protein family [Lupinus albus]|uniref:Putative DNA mismatch repair protein family n=1 Tax=Lupinus albus TaxID=3870 RepID=A0A6A4P1I4_LUPAL|nr:putative DNA mismatch repair protein family [Lupinus albus]
MNIELDQHNSPEYPPKIHRLSHSVVKRITAGDVIQRPLSAVKELIENSLDAHSTNINVIIKNGGLKLIQVNDNGHGIRYEDLPIMCERHTTSKLLMFEELMRMKTMGFRGEALSSISHLGHVTVTTITQGHVHGYRVSYKDGAMEHEPKPCAAVKGTQIMVENLFYNMVASKKTSQNSHGDYTKIVDLVSRFAIHHINVSFSCRKHKATRPDIHTTAASSRLDIIRSVYGVEVARSLMKIEAADNNPAPSVFEMHGFMSNASYAAKKMTMILFINDRLVEWSALKRAIEVVYTKKMHKASKPFVYISIVLPPDQIDVNIHASKKEVSILNQEVIIEQIKSMVKSRLRSSNEAQSFEEQIARQSSPSQINTSMMANLNSMAMESRSRKVHKLFRTNSLDLAGRLHACVQTKFDGYVEKGACSNAVRSSVSPRGNPKTAADLTSVQELLAVINNDCDLAMMDIVRHCSYIGMTDDVFVVLQHNTHLYLANIVNLSKELIYQQVLSRFAHHCAICISDPLPLKDLILLALKEHDIDLEVNDDDNLKEKTAEMKSELLKQKAEMLEEFFGIDIDEHGNISGLPVILNKHTPNMDHIHEFALCLGNDVDWEDEKNCIQGISVALGNLYAMHPPMFPNPFGDGLLNYKKVNQLERGTFDSTGVDAINNIVEHGLLSPPKSEWTKYEWKIQHLVFPSLRDFLKPPMSMATNGTFVKVKSLERLNKLLGRC